ncbi:MAG TPA: alpha/beta hydrolase [Anaerolineaceae bacterium]|jgi:pimeloyl-ACP methyl ester carboxylesterase
MQKKVGDITIHYVEQGEGFPVILLHGFPLDHTIWEATVTGMKSGARIIQPDLRGFGRSDAPEGVYSMRLLADDVARLMDALGLGMAVLVGHSMAGYLALEFAGAYPERLAGIGLVSTQALADTPERRSGRLAQAEDVLAHGPKTLASSMTPRLTADHQYHAEIYRIILRNQPNGLAGALKGMAERRNNTALLPAIAVPSVVVAGLDDQLIPVERSREMAASLPRVELVEITGAGHMPMMEKPVETASAIDRLVLEVASLI